MKASMTYSLSAFSMRNVDVFLILMGHSLRPPCFLGMVIHVEMDRLSLVHHLSDSNSSHLSSTCLVLVEKLNVCLTHWELYSFGKVTITWHCPLVHHWGRLLFHLLYTTLSITLIIEQSYQLPIMTEIHYLQGKLLFSILPLICLPYASLSGSFGRNFTIMITSKRLILFMKNM